MKYSPAERRALEQELTRRRCAGCNRAGGVQLVNRQGDAGCGQCGRHFVLEATFGRVLSNGNSRLIVATFNLTEGA